MSVDAKIATAKQARARAQKAGEYVRDLRRMLGQAMREQADAQKIARELEQAAAR